MCSQHLSVLLVAQNAGCFPGSVLKRENSHAQLRTSHKPARTSTFCSSSQKQKATLARESKDAPDRSWHGNSDPQVCLPSQHTKKLPDRDAGCLTSSHLRLHKTLTFSNRPGGPGIQTQNSQITKLLRDLALAQKLCQREAGHIPTSCPQGTVRFTAQPPALN